MQSCELTNFCVEGILAMSQHHVTSCRELVIGLIHNFLSKNDIQQKMGHYQIVSQKNAQGSLQNLIFLLKAFRKKINYTYFSQNLRNKCTEKKTLCVFSNDLC